MGYKNMWSCVADLEKNRELIRIKSSVDPNLEMAEIHRRIYDQGGPAILFEKVSGSPFPALSNLYGTISRTEFLFRDTFADVKKIIELKADPTNFLRNPLRYWKAPLTALTALPKKTLFPASAWGKTTISQLPQIKSWPMDGGAFITLPQVFSLPPGGKNMMKSNIGMYRVQLSGNEYIPDKEIGLHYQLHRGIGVHHTAYNKGEEPFRVSIFVGGLPSHAFSAIMPLPEGLSEMTFAGLLAGRRFQYAWKDDYVLSGDADFVITGIIRKNATKPEGPFGDHLGYYSLEHPFPVMEVEQVWHRKNPIWHFTVVGRPPQEDSSFGYLIHELVKDLTAGEFPGVKQIHAVDAAGVHPLLLAIGSERYMPFREKRPEEILIQANRILGSGQTSLAKFLLIADGSDTPELDTHDYIPFLTHILERIDLTRDLHFQTKTTIDTLDYSGDGWNAGSKVIIAACGPKLRTLGTTLPTFNALPPGFSQPRVVLPGILAISAPPFTSKENYQDNAQLITYLENYQLDEFPLCIVCDDSHFLSQNISNFIWATFTRTNPSHDIHGVRSFIENKHWGCKGSLLFDARVKTHHAPPLITDPKISAKVDAFFKKGGELAAFG
jgi:4-hydroxy-3-polyprenylbenzoate decarboxylase